MTLGTESPLWRYRYCVARQVNRDAEVTSRERSEKKGRTAITGWLRVLPAREPSLHEQMFIQHLPCVGRDQGHSTACYNPRIQSLKGNEDKRKVVEDMYRGPERDHRDLWETPLGRGRGDTQTRMRV